MKYTAFKVMVVVCGLFLISSSAFATKSAKVEKSKTLSESVTDEFSTLSTKLVAGANETSSESASASSQETEASSALMEAGVEGLPTSESGVVSKEESPSKIDTSKLAESEIPIMTNTKEEKKVASGQFQRVMITLGVLIILFGGVSLGLKRWMRNTTTKGNNTKIKILTQHHLGAKKSLAIIQVAGESLLIGITDQNISMLKSLSLLDEEVPEDVPRHFDRTMASFDENDAEDEEAQPRGREDFAMHGLSEIRDVVSRRLNGFKNLE